MKYSPGDKINIHTKDEHIAGILMPSPESKEETVVVKLDNGYNIGIDKRDIRKISLIKKHKQEKLPGSHIAKKKGIPFISILHTGGTIASKVDYQTGGVIARFTPEELLLQFPELNNIANIKSRLIRNMWSEDMRFAHYNIMAREIKKEAEAGVAGIIITHGTDTLHYTSAALSFMLDIGIPVILVGAQRSSDRGSTDAGMNLICAANFIVKSDFAGVAICMHGTISDTFCNILPAVKSRKLHTSRRDAFQPVNDTAIARVYYDGRIEFTKEYRRKSAEKVSLKLMKPGIKVGILKAHPNMYASEVDAYKGFDGLVLEGTGLGQMPVSVIDEETKEHEKILRAIHNLIKAGTVVVMSPQTIFGRLQMNVYSPARKLQEIGVLGNYLDMTPETTFIKLAWLLSNYPKEKAKELISSNLRGEISERITEETFP
jgi:glutamyl-tRNA(Gln) amidotransferase subunit D